MFTSSSASVWSQGEVFGPACESCEVLGRPIYACRRGGPHGETLSCLSSGLPQASPRPRYPGAYRGPGLGHSPQWQRSLSGDKECCLSSFPRQALAWSCWWLRTVRWGWEWYPHLPRVTWLARGSPKLGRTTSSISPWDPGCLESGGRGLRIQGGLRARWSAESGPHLACTLIMAEWAAAPIDPLARGCPGEVILALASEELWLLASPR